MQFVYLLKLSNGDIYKGCTRDVAERLERHQSGYVESTMNSRPLKLICYFAFENKHKAFDFEKYLKTGSGRAFINKHLI